MGHKQSVLMAAVVCLCVVLAGAQTQGTGSPGQSDTTKTILQELEQRGDAFRSQKEFISAIEVYEQAIKRAPKNPVLWNKAGMAELQLGRYDAAKRRFERAVKLKKDYAEAINNLGVVYYSKKHYSKAATQYRKALQVRESASFHSNLGAAYFDQKDYQAAMVEYLRALQLDPEVFERTSATGISAHVSKPEDRAQYAFMLARLYAKAGDTDHCLNQLRRAMENGYPNLKQAVETDEVFVAVRQDPKFVELMQADVPGIPQ